MRMRVDCHESFCQLSMTIIHHLSPNENERHWTKGEKTLIHDSHEKFEHG